MKDRSVFAVALLFSLIGHVLVIAAYMFFSRMSPPLNLDQRPIRVTLIRAGKEREKTLLPRLPTEQHVEVKKVVNKEPTQKKKDLLDVLKKRLGKPSDEGMKGGVQGGENLQGELAESYTQQVYERIKESYALPPMMMQDKYRQLMLWVRIYIAANGSLIRVKIEKSSGVAIFDNTVVVGAKSIKDFGPPPLLSRDVYARQGLLLVYCPVECPKGE